MKNNYFKNISLVLCLFSVTTLPLKSQAAEYLFPKTDKTNIKINITHKHKIDDKLIAVFNEEIFISNEKVMFRKKQGDQELIKIYDKKRNQTFDAGKREIVSTVNKGFNIEYLEELPLPGLEYGPISYKAKIKKTDISKNYLIWGRSNGGYLFHDYDLIIQNKSSANIDRFMINKVVSREIINTIKDKKVLNELNTIYKNGMPLWDCEIYYKDRNDPLLPGTKYIASVLQPDNGSLKRNYHTYIINKVDSISSDSEFKPEKYLSNIVDVTDNTEGKPVVFRFDPEKGNILDQTNEAKIMMAEEIQEKTKKYPTNVLASAGIFAMILIWSYYRHRKK